MKRFANLSIRYKLLAPITLIAACLAVLGVQSLQQLSRVGDITGEIAQSHLPRANFLLEADRDLHQALIAERSLLFVRPGDPRFQELMDTHAENIRQARERVHAYAALAPEESIQARVRDFEAASAHWETLTGKVLQARGEPGSAAGAIAMSFGEASQAFDDMRAIIDELTLQTLTLASQADTEATTTATEARYIIAVSAGVGLLICVLLAVLFPPLLLRPLERMRAHMDTISQGEGDLTLRLSTGGNDELGALGQSVNRFLDSLQALVAGVVESSAGLDTAARHLSELAAASTESVRRQQLDVDQVATAMNEMTATVQEVARNASGAAAGAQRADDEVQKGNRVVDASIRAINSLAGEVESAGTALTELEHETGRIGSVLGVIEGVAEQTNLLALNAAIEAARAGEQGRGFAVVADEVRTLASRTQDSTREIQQMIESLQASTVRVVQLMSSGRERAEASVREAAAAGESLSRISEAVSDITDQNAQIASAAEEQSQVAEDMNRNMVRIHEESQRAAGSSEETAQSAHGIAGIAGQMQGRMSRFKV